jgi:predicted component of type VI protein secretion system
MKTKLAVLAAMGVAATLVTACGHDDHTTMNPPPPPPPTVLSLDTAAVLAMAVMSSETADPIMVDDGVVVLTDTSETTDPISVYSM